MKKHLSVLMIASRTIWCVVAVILITAVVQTALFAAVPGEMSETSEYWHNGWQTQTVSWRVSLPETFMEGRTGIVAAVGFAAMCLILCIKTSGYGSAVRYTVARLGVREEAVNLWWALYFAACVVLFWMSQILVMQLLCRMYVAQADPTEVNGQTVAIAWYTNVYLHNLMPGADMGRWVRNILLVPMLGTALARFSMMQRRREGVSFLTIAVFALTMIAFCMDLDNGFAYAMILLELALFGMALAKLLTVYRADETEEGGQSA